MRFSKCNKFDDKNDKCITFSDGGRVVGHRGGEGGEVRSVNQLKL